MKKGNVSAADLDRAGLEIIHHLPQVDLAVVGGQASEVRSVTREFEPDTRVVASLPVKSQALETETITDEQDYPFQWDKKAQHIPEVQDITLGGGSRVAVLDTGIDRDHPDLIDAFNKDLSRNFASDGSDPGAYDDIDLHGTHVSGIIAASIEGTLGMGGTAPETDLLALRVFLTEDVDGDGEEDVVAYDGDIITAMIYAADNNSDAINLSLGSYDRMRDARGYYGRVYNRVNSYVFRQGTLIIAAAGNDGLNLNRTGDLKSVPSGTAQIMSVSATGPIGYGWPLENENGNGQVELSELEDPIDLEEPYYHPAFYTNYGTRGVDIAAPGGNIDLDALDDEVAGWWLDMVFSTYPGGYGWAAGTSMAAPQVVGAAALLASVDDGPRASQAHRIKSVLKQTAFVPDEYSKKYYGAEFIDPLAAVQEMN